MNHFCLIAALTAASTAFAQTPPTAPAKPKPTGVKPAPRKPSAAKSKPATTGTGADAPEPAGKFAVATPAKTADNSKVVLTIGDEKITEKAFEDFIEVLPENMRAQAKGPMKRQVAEQMVSVKVLANEARKRGIANDPAVRARMQFQMDNMLAGALFNDLQSKAVTDEAALQKYYEDHKGEFEQAQARHILIRFKGSPAPAREGQPELTKEEALAKANDLRKRITGGEDFAALAKENSADTASGANGGDLGTFGRGAMVPAFEKTVFTMPIGEVSEPVETQFGYHLIKVEKRESKSFDQVKTDLANRIKPETARKQVDELRKSTNVVFDDAYFGAAAK